MVGYCEHLGLRKGENTRLMLTVRGTVKEGNKKLAKTTNVVLGMGYAQGEATAALGLTYNKPLARYRSGLHLLLEWQRMGAKRQQPA
jgi:hypothetical protein